MGLFSNRSSQEQQAPRNPSNLVMFRLLAVGYVLYLCVSMVKLYLAGGPDAPSLPMLVLGLAVLGGGAVFLAIISYREWKRAKPRYDQYMEDLRTQAEAKRAAEEEAEEEADLLPEPAEDSGE